MILLIPIAMRFEAREYQKTAIAWVQDHPRCLLFLDMGLGKTVSTLTAFMELQAYGEAERMLVVAPKKVAESTWSDECGKWEHLRGLRVSVVLGDRKRREAALREEADVYVTSRDNFVWLCEHYRNRLPFDMVVLDELSSFKTPGSLRFKAARRVLPDVARVVGLTGTPAPNGLKDLWAQVYCIDGGARLGRFVTHFRQRWFDVRTVNNIPVKITPKRGAQEEIEAAIRDITLSMQAKDWLELPEMIINERKVRLDEKAMRRYRDFERQEILHFADESAHTGQGADRKERSVIANGAASLMNKLSQFANGAVYDDEKSWHAEHDAKLEALKECVEAADTPVLVYYQYQSDRERILKALGSGTRVYADERDLHDWNAGKIPVLLAHPMSTAFGLNMQQGGRHIVWYSTGWNLELWLQGNARLHRQGQERPVVVTAVVAAGTVGERMMRSLREKKSVQSALLDNISYLIKKKGGISLLV